MKTETLDAELRAAGQYGITVAQIAHQLGRSNRQVERLLRAQSAVERIAPGRYRLREGVQPTRAILTETGEKIWRVLAKTGLDAYLTGLDVVADAAQHQLLAFPHIVVVETGGAEDLAASLDAEGLIPVLGGTLPAIADPDRVVVVREARGRSAPVYQIRHHVAPPEVAWIDLYREVRNGVIALEPKELGRMLGNLLRMPGFEPRFKTIARRHFARELLPIGRANTDRGRARAITAGLAE
jgi:hypothetical protein